jgi:hypothetical protein
VRPTSGQPLMLRTLSMPVWRLVRSTPRSFSQISGMVSMVKPRSSICWRVVMSSRPLPMRRERSAMARSRVLVANQLGTRMRITKWLGWVCGRIHRAT